MPCSFDARATIGAAQKNVGLTLVQNPEKGKESTQIRTKNGRYLIHKKSG
jgi:hypothetical protein